MHPPNMRTVPPGCCFNTPNESQAKVDHNSVAADPHAEERQQGTHLAFVQLQRQTKTEMGLIGVLLFIRPGIPESLLNV